MSRIQAPSPAVIAGCLGLAVSLAGCGGNVKQDVYTAEVAKLREEIQAGDRQSAARADSTNRALAEQQRRITAMEPQFQSLRQEYQVGMEKVKGQLKFNVPVHFDFDQSELRDTDRPVLDRFASVVKEFYPGGFVTVEGFADPAGSYAYNLELGQARADAVREYLVGTAGLSADSVRAVSYGEVQKRQVMPEAQGPGDAGIENRRVTLVIEHVTLREGGVATPGGAR